MNLRVIQLAILAMALQATAHTGLITAEDAAFSIVGKLLHDDAFAGAHDVELEGDLAFVPGKWGSLAIVNVADPRNPEILWYKRDEQETPDAETVMPLGSFLLLGTRDLLSIDIAEPSRPVVLKKVSDPTRIDRINGMVKIGDHVIAANKSGYIDVFDIRDIERPILRGAVETRTRYDLKYPHDIDRFQDFVVVVDPNGFAPPLGRLGIFRVSNGEQLLTTDEWMLEGVVEGTELIGANRVQVSGSYALVGGSLSPNGRGSATANMTVVDISDPKNPNIVAALPFEDLRGPNGLTVVGQVAFYAGGQTICAVDISDPRRPVVLASQSFPKFKTDAARTDNYHDLIYRDGYLYVSAQSDNGLLIMQVDDKRIRELTR